MFCVFDMQIWGLGFRARALDSAGSNRRFKKGSSYKLLMPMLHTLCPGDLKIIHSSALKLEPFGLNPRS